MFLHALKNLKYLVGLVGILITLDFFLFDGFCTQACSEALSQASNQIHLDLLKDFSPTNLFTSFSKDAAGRPYAAPVIDRRLAQLYQYR